MSSGVKRVSLYRSDAAETQRLTGNAGVALTAAGVRKDGVRSGAALAPQPLFLPCVPQSKQASQASAFQHTCLHPACRQVVRWPDSVNGSVQVLLQWHEMPSSREDARLFRDGQGKVRWVGQRGRSA